MIEGEKGLPQTSDTGGELVMPERDSLGDVHREIDRVIAGRTRSRLTRRHRSPAEARKAAIEKFRGDGQEIFSRPNPHERTGR